MSEFFSEKMDIVINPKQIIQGIEKQEFTPYFQPIFCSSNGEFFGCEVLIRWEHPEMGIILPDFFIPVAEDTNLIVPLTSLLMKRTINILKTVTNIISNNLHVSININMDVILSPTFEDECIFMLDMLGKDKVTLILELTEKKKINNITAVYEVLDRLRKNNILFALDDFCTEYSTFNYLRFFNVDFIKLDKSFIQLAGIHKKTEVIVDNISSLANELHINIIAEGIETEEQANLMKNKRVRYLQGYFFSPPVSGDVFIKKYIVK